MLGVCWQAFQVDSETHERILQEAQNTKVSIDHCIPNLTTVLVYDVSQVLAQLHLYA